MTAYIKHPSDRGSFFEKAGKAQQLARYKALKELLAPKSASTNYEEDLEIVEVILLIHQKTEGFGRAENLEKVLAFRRQELDLADKYGQRIPYHPSYAAWLIKMIKRSKFYEIGEKIEEEIEHITRVMRNYFRLPFDLEDLRYLRGLIAEELEARHEEETSNDDNPSVRRLDTAASWLREREQVMKPSRRKLSLESDERAHPSKPKQPQKQIALMYIYNRIPMTWATAPDIASKAEWKSKNSGLRLYRLYADWFRSRTGASDGQVKSLIKDIKAVIPLLEGDAQKRAEDDLRVLLRRNLN